MSAAHEESDIRQYWDSVSVSEAECRTERRRRDALEALRADYLALETDAKYVFKTHAGK